jgi:glucosyl-3-phosphoglycerate phosphatase
MEPGLLLVRHGQSTWNAIHRWAGQADPPLSEEGRRQARQLARRLRSFPFGVVVSSDLSRAAETATVVAEGLGLAAPTSDARLRERHCIWSGLTSDEIEELHPGQLDAWRSGELRDLPGESEPWEAFRERIEAALDEHARRSAFVLVVARRSIVVVAACRSVAVGRGR